MFSAQRIPLLGPEDPLPPVTHARQDLGGLLALGGGLSVARLLAAYRCGIFPWGTQQGLPVWYYPTPRMVLFPDELRISRSLQKNLRNSPFEFRHNHNFSAVIDACATQKRPHQDGTWISAELRAAYGELHRQGWAHSAETWLDGELIGGLYGLWIGKVFFGESMFTRQSNASKFAFAHWVAHLRHQHCALIDCQMHTAHLASLGAREISGTQFQHHLRHLIA
ncbi:leucyl/phenylalanyl-tRNA--protein transferase [Azonexus sp.]|uniref:leucyl/phenylalanyl-tRNA--protein transferase n=1 Tax=Azonexus sp. TaxID=1872668 RepID=UPI0039E649E5